MKFLFPEMFAAEVLIITGGLSAVQIVPLFFNRSLAQMQQNLNNLVRLRNYLETYSLITALLRHHFSSAEHLNSRDLEKLEKQMAIIQDVVTGLGQNFRDISLAVRDGTQSVGEIAPEPGTPTGRDEQPEQESSGPATGKPTT